MKNALWIVLFLLTSFTGWGGAVAAPNTPYDVLYCGKEKIYRLKQTEGKEFLLSNIIFPQQKRQVKVLAYVNFPFSPSPADSSGYLAKNPHYWRAVEEVYPYLQQAWKDWRAAANAWLPEKFRLPELSFTLLDGYRLDAARQPRWGEDSLNLSLEITSGKYGLFMRSVPDPVRGAGIALFTKEGNGFGRILFFLEQEWMDWLNTEHLSQEEQTRRAAEYQKAAGAQLAGEFYAAAVPNGYDWERDLSSQARRYIRQLAALSPTEWSKQGPWAHYNQRLITHEMGHLFGLVHIQDSASVMDPVLAGGRGTARPSASDGLRLAALVCWYHNQRAGKNVCTPLSAKKHAAFIQRILQNSLQNSL